MASGIGVTVFEFVLGALATHRLSLLLSREDGPAWIFRKIRQLPPPRSSARQGLGCLLCVSVSFSSLVCSYYVWMGKLTWPEFTVPWLAMSSAAILMHMQWTKEV